MKYKITILFSFWLLISFSQDFENKKDCLDLIKSKDISHLWTTEKIQIEEDTATIERPPAIGFIGENYQRFFIHFNSVIKNPSNKIEYLVYGKTKVKGNICEFQGKIVIQEAYTYFFQDISDLKQGYLIGSYEFYENPIDKGSGVLKGEFGTDFFIDTNDQIQYNGLMLMADGFENNQFEGVWTSYNTGKSKKCNWGDYRIPDSGDLDLGAGEFSPSEKYNNMGWENYRLAYFTFEENDLSKKAYQKEKAIWWSE